LKATLTFFLFFLLTSLSFFGQQNTINIKSILNPAKDELIIQQEIVFVNKSDSILKNIFLHNWANSFRDRKTPLSKRFIKDFRKDLYFAKDRELGATTIKNLSIDFKEINFEELEKNPDIVKVPLNEKLFPKDSVKITATYIVKIPSAKFTGYGKTKDGYNLRFWYLTPAVYKNGWQLMSNLNLDDLYEDPTDYTIEIDIPKEYILESNIYKYTTSENDFKNYFLVAKNKTDIVLSIHKTKRLQVFKTDDIKVYTNVIDDKLKAEATVSILKKELAFLRKYLGKFPHKEIFIDKASQRKDPIHGLSQLPSFIRPFSDDFTWELTMLKAITKEYIENTLFLNDRKDYWFLDGLQNYLMIEYIEEFYPDMKLLGKYSNSWFLKTFNISKLDFNDKYPFIYQFTARQFLDQSLNTSADSLSNFNKRIVTKYKAGLGFRYLKGYIGKEVLNKTLEEFYQQNRLKTTSSKEFERLIKKNTDKDLDWFFTDYINTNKKIDYTIDELIEEGDSIKVVIRNKRNITTPVSLYGVKDREIKFKKWITGIDSIKEVTVPKGDFKKFALNYENLYPEYNTFDNWKTLDKKIFNKPLKFSLIKDVPDPYYNQFFYQPNASYNFYNGLILGVGLHNKPLIKRNLELSFSPSYAIKSNSLIGSFSVIYNQFFEKTKIYKIMYGVSGLTSDYAPNLSFKTFNPFVNVIFKRKSLRDATTESLSARLVHIDKDVPLDEIQTADDNYSVLSIRYNYINPDIIQEFRYNYNLEFAQNFSKISADIRYRSLTASDTQLDFRIFAGAFLHNNSEGDYFSFGLDRANDYLFQLNYFGRSEDSGIFSQQFIIAEGGFKSVLPTRFANRYMLSLNSSIGLWRWIEFYNDVAFLKNRNTPLYFGYNNGIRFTLTADFNAIINFFRRGLF
jgi:hypothetical protein